MNKIKGARQMCSQTSHFKLVVCWPRGRETASFHEDRVQAECEAIRVLTSSGTNKNGVVLSLSIHEQIGNIPSSHGI